MIMMHLVVVFSAGSEPLGRAICARRRPKEGEEVVLAPAKIIFQRRHDENETYI
jgi:hypothetical protein